MSRSVENTQDARTLQRELAFSLNSAQSLQDAVRFCLEAAIRVAGVDAGTLYVVEPASGDLVLMVGQGMSDAFHSANARHKAQSEKGRIIMAGKPLYARYQDIITHPDALELKEGLRAVAIIPIQHAGAVVASLNVGSHYEDVIAPDVRDDLESIAQQSGTVIARFRAEEALREREARLRALLNALPDLMFLQDREGRYLDYHAGEPDMLLVAPSTFLGKKMEEVLPPDLVERFERSIQRLLQHGETQLLNYKLLQAGKERYYEARLVPCEDHRILSIIREITEQKNAEMALRKSESFLKSVFSSIQDGISVLDQEMTIVQVNETMERWYAHAMPLVGKKCYEAYHGRRVPCEVCPVHQTLQQRQVALEVVPKTGPKGEIEGWLDLYSFPLYDQETNTLCGVIEYVRDITERKRAEDALRSSEMKYRALVRDAGDAILLVEPDGLICEVNKRMEDLLGRAGEVLIGRSFVELHAVAERSKAESFLQRTVSTKKTSSYDTLLETQQGETIPVDITITSIHYQERELIQCIARDISELKKVERLKDNVIRDVTHKLKTPIAMAQMGYDMLSLAMETDDAELHQKSMNMLASSIAKLRMEANSIVEYFKLSLRREQQALSPTSLRTMVDRIIGEERCLLGKKPVDFLVEIDDDADALVMEGMELDMLLSNIINNAIKFTQRGSIAVRATAFDGGVRIVVQDTGVGLAPEVRKRVFERFYQSTPASPGMGLGLSMCKEIVERYQGNIFVESDGFGKGTTVTLELPGVRVKQ